MRGALVNALTDYRQRVFSAFVEPRREHAIQYVEAK